MCQNVCPFGAISMIKKQDYLKKSELAIIDLNKCTYCGACVQSCKFNALEFRKDVFRQTRIDKNLYRGIWIYAEQRHGEIHSVVYELLNEGKRLSEKLKTSLSAVLIGNNVKLKAQNLINRGAEKVYVCDDPIFNEFQDDPYTDILTQLIEKEKPEIIFMGATNIGRSFASRVAARIGTGLTADCISLDVDIETRNLLQTRPAFCGNVMATILTPNHRPQMATVRHKVFKEAKVSECEKKGEIVEYKADINTLLNRTKFLSFIENVKNNNNVTDVTNANIIVAGGRGLGSLHEFNLIVQFAQLIGGAVGASRPAVDAKWISYSNQIGQTGKIVTPKIYIACGISGQTHHMVGINYCDIIIAINKDANCPIMQSATYAFEGDLHEILPNVIKKIKSLRC
jgi:electron transfer flavoprotein alpha subunit